jgi:hypothetical protein
MSSDSLVLVKGSGAGGLGDRLRTVLVAALYARSSQRGLAVDWRDGLLADPGFDVFDALFRLQGVREAPLPAPDTQVRPTAWQGRLDRSMDEVYVEDGTAPWDRAAAIARYSFDLGRLDHPEPVVVMWEFDQLPRVRAHLPDALRQLDDEALLGAAWTEFLWPSRPVEEEVEQWLGSDPIPRVGVHVRATREAERQKGKIPLDRYFTAVDRLLALLGTAEVVLATDNLEVEERFRARYGRLRTRPKWFPPPGEAIHLLGRSPNRFLATFDALVEVLGLARCDGLVTRRDSSFSMIARLASKCPRDRRILLEVQSRGFLGRLRDRVDRGRARREQAK